MNIAVVGGGARCRLLLELIEKHAFQELNPNVVAVADLRNDAPGLVKAKEKGLFVTNDYNDLFDRDDLDLIIELTGDNEVFFDIVSKKKKSVKCSALSFSLCLLLLFFSFLGNNPFRYSCSLVPTYILGTTKQEAQGTRRLNNDEGFSCSQDLSKPVSFF